MRKKWWHALHVSPILVSEVDIVARSFCTVAATNRSLSRRSFSL
jgi:hypothetical protein